MKYVMVPVPEELFDEATSFVKQVGMRAKISQGGTKLDTESVVAVVRALNAPCRTALAFLAKAKLAGSDPTIGEIATEMGWTEHETVGVVHELNELVWEKLGPVMMIMPTAASDARAGAIDWNERKVVIWTGLANEAVGAGQQLPEGA